MPILAGLPVLPTPPARTFPFAETRTLAFRSLSGLDLIQFTGKEFFAMQGIEGLDLPPIEVIREKIPGMAGTRLREVIPGERQIFLPLFIASESSHVGFLDNRDRITALFDHEGVDFQTENGTFDLVANSDRGERSLRCMYLEGMAGSRTVDTGGTWWESIGLTLLACQPYWRGEDWTTPTIFKTDGVGWFPDFPPELSPSRALGVNMPITVKGDVNSYVSVDATGPADSVTVTGTGLSVSIPAGLAAGETLTLHTDPRYRDALFDGVRDWSRVAPNDHYGSGLRKGEQTISIVLAGATTDTSGRVYGQSLYKRWC